MGEFINTIDLLGDDVVCQSLVDRSIVEFRDNLITSTGYNSFRFCESLTMVDLPSVTLIKAYSFYECTALKTVDLSSVERINFQAFYYCKLLTTVVLRTSTMCKLENSNVFDSTPIISGTGYIYVPSALVSSYQSDPKWSTYKNQFRALEDYTVDGTTTGELDTSKI